MFRVKCLIFIVIFFAQLSLNAQHKLVEKGIASYYHDHLRLHKTANGELYYPSEMTAAHLTLPFNTLVEVRNLENKKSVKVRINDRGPFVENRIIDLSRAAADSLDMLYQGLVNVQVKVISFGEAYKQKKVNVLASNNIIINKKKKADFDNNSPDSARFLKDNIASKVIIPRQFIANLEVENEDLAFSTFGNSGDNSKNIQISIVSPKNIEVNNSEVFVSTEMVYGIQIGSFRKRSNMEKLSERLKKNFIEKFNVQEINKGDTLYYRMILGEFENESSALKLKSRLEKEFPGCFVTKYNK